MPVPASLLDAIAAVVGPKGALTDPADIAPHLEEERGLYHGATPMVVKPASTAEVAEVVRLCHAAGVGIVPQGGNTGLCGGAVSENDQIVLSLARMNAVESVDPLSFTMTLQAGCILADVQKKADDAGCYFPLSLGAEGSCQIGGNLATNAGGLNVLKYGNARDLVLGLEVVLPDGRIWNGLRSLGKDNTGYALKHLFMGADGTLGIITRAVLKLFPKPLDTQTALCAVADLDAAIKLFGRARAASGDAVSAFELISKFAFEITCATIDGVSNPLEDVYDWYVMIELTTSSPSGNLREVFETILEGAFEDGEIVDAVIAESLDQRNALWRMRESIPEAQKLIGASIKHDVAVPVQRVPEFLAKAMAAVEAALPGLRPCPFGHVGDGNIHFNLTQPEGMDPQDYLGRWEAMNRIVHDIVAEMDGSISAEHGVGKLKVDEIVHYKDAVEIDLFKAIKRALDPANTMNPGKMVRLDD